MIFPRTQLDLIDHPLEVKLQYDDYEVLCLGEVIGTVRRYYPGTHQEYWLLTEPFVLIAGTRFYGKGGAVKACERLVNETYKNYDQYDETLNSRRPIYE